MHFTMRWFYVLVAVTFVMQVICAIIDIHRHQWVQLFGLLVSMGVMLYATWFFTGVQRKLAARDESRRRRSAEP